MSKFAGSSLAVCSLALGLLIGLPSVGVAGHGSNDHWSDQGDNRAEVTLVDHTGPSWPVAQHAGRWDNQIADLHVLYASPGNCSKHCVSVDTSNFGDCGFPYGMTSGGLTSSGHMTGDRQVRFNVTCVNGLSDGGRSELTCHELGHAVGRLVDGRPHSDPTCMRGGSINSPYERFPDGHDQAQLATMYSHND